MNDGTVMIVDDDDDLREMLALIVGADGYDTIEAVDGVDALEQIEHGSHPRLILLDLRMPRMNGTEFLGAIREVEDGVSIPVVALTGDVAAGGEAMRAGASAVLRKPVEKRALLDAIHSYVR